MKLMCITTEPNIYNSCNIKVGEVYDAMDYERTWDDRFKMIYIVIATESNGQVMRQEYPKSCFMPLDEWREKQINTILDDKGTN